MYLDIFHENATCFLRDKETTFMFLVLYFVLFLIFKIIFFVIIMPTQYSLPTLTIMPSHTHW